MREERKLAFYRSQRFAFRGTVGIVLIVSLVETRKVDMKREGTYTFSPRVVHSRTSFLDITSAIYNYEACYRSKELHLRERILFHRAAVNFEKDLRQISSSWFSQHNADALINVNEHSLLLGQRLAPRHQLTMNDFRVAEYPFGVFRWDLLKVLEVDIGDYLLVRNHNINRYRPEHLNDPMNYFFVDVKRFIRIAAKEKNTKLALKLIDRVIDYTCNDPAYFAHTKPLI